MSGTFLMIFIALLAAITFWRLTLVIILALLLTMFLTGINGIVDAVEAGQNDQRAVPAPPGQDSEPPFDIEPPR